MTSDEAIKHCEEVADVKELKQLKEQTWSLDDAREDFMYDVYKTLESLPTNDEANRIIEVFDRVTSDIRCDDAISRQAVIDEIEFYQINPQHFDFVSLIGDIKDLPSVTPQQTRWIPCSEKMPKEEKKSYWICTDYGYQCECRWTNVNPFWTDLTTDWHWHIMDIPRHQEIVAWMPLPEPYMAESKE